MKKKCYFTLPNGVHAPYIGYDMRQIPDGCLAYCTVKFALSCGYRHINTAMTCGNAKSIGEGIRDSTVLREELFIADSLPEDIDGYEAALAAVEKNLELLGLNYLDMCLIRRPSGSREPDEWKKRGLDVWKALSELYKAGKIRALGVFDFQSCHLQAFMETDVTPMVNQIEFHSGQTQQDTVKYCQENGILVEAWSPLGTEEMFSDQELKEIADRYQITTAQLCIRWCLQRGILPLIKSTTPSRIQENINVDVLKISEKDMDIIDGIKQRISGFANSYG